MLGERLSQLVGFEKLKLAAGTGLLSPFLPLLFSGEEYGETAPFLYFVSHSDPKLLEQVGKGRAQRNPPLSIGVTKFRIRRRQLPSNKAGCIEECVWMGQSRGS